MSYLLLFKQGSKKSLIGIDKLEVWHDGHGFGHDWFADYIAIIDNQTSEEACFLIAQYLNTDNGGVEEKHLFLNRQETNGHSCRDHGLELIESSATENPTENVTQLEYRQTYRVATKTGEPSSSVDMYQID